VKPADIRGALREADVVIDELYAEHRKQCHPGDCEICFIVEVYRDRRRTERDTAWAMFFKDERGEVVEEPRERRETISYQNQEHK
jgi:hypothetical protein